MRVRALLRRSETGFLKPEVKKYQDYRQVKEQGSGVQIFKSAALLFNNFMQLRQMDFRRFVPLLQRRS